jgi:hypothetical protein
MSFTRTAKAVVVSCSLAASEQITVDLTVTLYQVQARVLESQYKDDVYTVTVVKPEGVGDLIGRRGNSNGKRKVLFRFNGRNRDRDRTRSRDYRSRVAERYFLRHKSAPTSKRELFMSQGQARLGRQGCVTSASRR